MNTADLARRLDNIVRFGVIDQTDFTTDPVQPRVRVKTGDILTAWIPISAARASSDAEHDPVQKGEHVILLAPSGELAQAVVVGKLFSTDYPSPDLNPDNHRRKYRDGAVIEYNSKTHHLNAVLPEDGTVNATAMGGFTFNGPITHNGAHTHNGDKTHNGAHTHNGDKTHNGDLNQIGAQTVSGDVIAGGISQINHTHDKTQPGIGSTGKPQ